MEKMVQLLSAHRLYFSYLRKEVRAEYTTLPSRVVKFCVEMVVRGND